MSFPDLLVPTYMPEGRDYAEAEADLHEEHASDCECSLCLPPDYREEA